MHSIDCGNAATTLKITQSSAKKERTLARFGLACSNFVETECLIVVQVILFKNRLWLFNYPYAGSIVLWHSSTQLQIATHCGGDSLEVTHGPTFYEMQAALFYGRGLPSYKLRHIVVL